MESQQIEVRCNIKFLVNLGWKKSDINESVKKIYGDTATKETTLYEWINRFLKWPRKYRSGRISISINNENISGVRALVKEDHILLNL